MVQVAGSVDETHEFFRRVRKDHEVLRDLLAALDVALAMAERDGAVEEARARAREEAVELFGKLEIRLAEHFEHEEKGEFIAKALCLAPRLSRRAAGLFEDHDILARRLREIGETARAAGTTAAGWQATHLHYQRFLERLRDHEQIESEVIQEALLDDLGGGG